MKTQILALLCLAPGMGIVGRAEAPPPNKVGVIQIQGALISTKEGQKAVADLEARLEPKKNQLEKQQSELRELQDRLQRGGNAMAEAAKNDLTRNIDQKTRNYNRDMQDAQEEAEQEQRKLFEELGQNMTQIIDKYAQANGFSVILDVSNQNTPVLYAASSIDITKEIVDLYDTASLSAGESRPSQPVAAAPPKPVPVAPASAAKKQPGQ